MALPGRRRPTCHSLKLLAWCCGACLVLHERSPLSLGTCFAGRIASTRPPSGRASEQGHGITSARHTQQLHSRTRGRVARPVGASSVELAAVAATPLQDLLPGIGAVIVLALSASAIQLSYAFSQPAGSAGDANPEGSFFGPVRWEGRTTAIVLVWLFFSFYAFMVAPGQSKEAKLADLDLIKMIIDEPFSGSVAPLFVGVFNSLGVWPLIYAATLLPGAARQSPVPALPFLVFSFFAGAFGLSPYLALREDRTRVNKDDLDWVTRNVLENRLLGAVFLLLGAYLALYAVGDGAFGSLALGQAWSAFVPLFTSSQLANVSCVDFMVLWMFYGPVVLEDGRRRGIFETSPDAWPADQKALFVASVGLPVFGGAIWMMLRPEIPEK